MTERWKRLQEIFEAAIDAPAAERDAIIARLSEGDDEMAREARDLVARHERIGESFLSPAAMDGGGGAQDMPSRIGPYRVLGLVGHGGMGTVYLARQDPLDRLVAIKTIRSRTPPPEILARFEAERQALALMDHPNVARIFGAGTDDGRAYFVMEFVQGLPIVRHVARTGASVEERLRLFLETCAAVEHAHQKGIIHRDLKPSNILVTDEEGAAHVKVIDFGIAKAAATTIEQHDLTLDGDLLGTIEYMSPEQAGGRSRDIDTRSDVYSLGVVLYELLTGVRPHDRAELAAAGIEEMLRIVRETDPPRPSERLRRLSSAPGAARPATAGADPATLSRRVVGDLDLIVMKALDKARERRYQAVGDLAEDVRRHLRDEPVLAGPPSRARRASKFVKRNARWVAAGAIASMGLLGGSAIAGWQAALARAERDQSRRAAAEAEWRAYTDAIASADAAASAADPRTARVILGAAPAPLRGWEWRHQTARLDASDRVLMTGDASLASLLVTPRGAVVGDGSGRVTVVDLASGRVALELPLHVRPITSMAMAPDGTVATGGFDARVGLMDVATGRAVVLEGASAGLRSVAFDPDGARVAACADDGTVALWDARTRALLRTLNAPACAAVAVTGDAVIVGGQGLASWRLRDGKPLRRSEPGTITCLRRAGERLLAGSARGEVLAVDPSALAIVERWKLSDSPVQCLDFDDRGRIAAGTSDHLVHVWDAAGGTMARLRGHEDGVLGVAFAADGSVVSSSRDGTLRTWLPERLPADGVIRGADARVASLAFEPGPDGPIVAAFGDARIRILDPRTAAVLRTIDVAPDRVESLLASRDGAELLAGTGSGRVRRWRLDDGSEQPGMQAGSAPVVAVMAGPERRIVVATGAGELLAFSGLDVAWRQALGGPLYAAGASADGSRIVVGWLDGRIEVRRGGDGTLLRELQPKGESVTAVALSPDGATVVGGGAAGGLWRWVATGEKAVLDRHGGVVNSIAFSPDGSRFATASTDRSVRAWSVGRSHPLATWRSHARAVHRVAFSEDGSRLASASEDGALTVRDSVIPRERR